MAELQTELATITFSGIIDGVVAVNAPLLLDNCLPDLLLVITLAQHSVEVDVLIEEIIMDVVKSLFKADAITQQIVEFFLCLVLSRNRQVHFQS
jgi:hypothetical protein